MMNKIILALVLGVVLGIGLSPAMAQTTSDYLNQIAKLEKQVADKDLIILEQIKVIMNIKDNYKKTYEPFSLEKFPQTDGFNPEWLKGESSKIKESCQEAQAMGYYGNDYCKFVQ